MELNELRNFIRTVINEQINSNIFNNGEISTDDAIEILKDSLSPIIPYVGIRKMSLGSDSIYIRISFQPKETWPQGYVENSNYSNFRIESDGTIENVGQTLYQKDMPIKYENRLPIKFRKTKAKSLEDAINKISKYIEQVNQFYK